MKMVIAVLVLMTVATAAWAGKTYGDFPLERAQITVYDGDTIFLDVPEWPAFAGEHMGVRIEGLDTPERHSRCADPLAKKHEEERAAQATEVLTSLLDSGQPIELRNIGRDKYFRILAQVWVGETNAADLLIGMGLAVSYHGEKKAGWCNFAV